MAVVPIAPGQTGGVNTSTFGAPVFDDSMTFREVGQTGLRQYGGWVREEFLPQLLGRQAARVYREMQDNDATIGSMLFAITQTMRKIKWRVKPADDSAEALAEAQFADSLRFDMSSTWEDFIVEALSMLAYGFSAHEIVYKHRNGRHEQSGPYDDIATSLFDDGRIGIRKLPIRSQDTVIKWFFGPNGSIEGLTQQPFNAPINHIPIEKLLLFRPTSHKGNPEGRSILRNSYRSWFFLKRFEEEEAIFYERMSGVPVMFVPQELMEAASSGDANAILQVNAYKRMVTNTKIGEQMGLLLPSNCWPNAMGAQGTAKMYEFQLVAPQGRASGPDSDKIISRHRLAMLMSVLADFVILGHAAHGTQSLAETKVDMFFQGVEGWLNGIAAVLNRYLLPRVWHLNALDPKLMPEFVPDLAQRLDIGALSDYVLKLAQSGMMMFPDTDLENYLRDSAGMPSIDETAYADNEQASNTAMSIDDINHNVAQRTPKPGLVTNPSIEATGTGAVSKPAAQAAIAKMLLAAEERRQRRHA